MVGPTTPLVHTEPVPLVESTSSPVVLVQLHRRERSSAGERLLHTQDVTGSIPVVPTVPEPVPAPALGHARWSEELAVFGYNAPSGPHYRKTTDRRFLYFIQAGDFVKVGIAFDVKKRLSDLKAGDPYGLLTVRGSWILPALFARQIERRVHLALDAFAVGREWFRMTVGEAKEIAKPVVQNGRAAHQHVVALGFWRDV